MSASDVLDALYALREHKQVAEEREELALSLKAFVQAAWPTIEPDAAFVDNWHITAICEHLEACSRGEIEKLQIWIPRRSMKSRTVSCLWNAWEWTHSPSIRYFTASYDLRLAGRLAGDTRDLMQSPWYQERWGDMFRFVREGERYYKNDHGGTRLATNTSTSSAAGEHAHRIIVDDPSNFKDVESLSRVGLEEKQNWYRSTVPGTRLNPCTEVLIMQRLHEDDLAGYLLADELAEWTVLCLPERYWDHPYAWRGDPRKVGELLWPALRNEQKSNEMARNLTAFRAAGQMQQWPSAREGELLLRKWWRCYDPKIIDDPKRCPKFRLVVQSWDTPLKDKESSDYVAGQCYGVIGGDKYLLDIARGQWNFSKAKRQVKEMAVTWRKKFPNAMHFVLIENAGYGVELIEELKRELGGVTKISPSIDGNKVMRAEAASVDLESGNIFVPAKEEQGKTYPDEHTCSADLLTFINELAGFPNASYDDQVDSWSQAMNWIRNRNTDPPRVTSALKRMVSRPLPVR